MKGIKARIARGDPLVAPRGQIELYVNPIESMVNRFYQTPKVTDLQRHCGFSNSPPICAREARNAMHLGSPGEEGFFESLSFSNQ